MFKGQSFFLIRNTKKNRALRIYSHFSNLINSLNQKKKKKKTNISFVFVIYKYRYISFYIQIL